MIPQPPSSILLEPCHETSQTGSHRCRADIARWIEAHEADTLMGVLFGRRLIERLSDSQGGGRSVRPQLVHSVSLDTEAEIGG